MSDQNYLSLQRHIAKSYALAQVLTLFDKINNVYINTFKSFTNSCIIAIRYIVSNIYILILQYDFDYLKELEKIKKIKLKWI